MAKKFLKVVFENRCNGCELCVLEAQRQLKRVGLSNSPIRVLRDATGSNLYFHIELEDSLNKLNIEEIFKICPTGVFEIMEEPDEAFIN